jgi:outer membrane protein assembly factor BamB
MYTKTAVALVTAIILAAPAFAAEPEALVAAKLLRSEGVRPGLWVHIGCGNGRLTAELAMSGRNLVHGVSPDEADVAEARKYVASRGLYGRVSIDQLGAGRLPYADGVVNVLVVQAAVPAAEVLRVLCPGGAAFYAESLLPAGTKGATKEGNWLKVVKPRPAGMDEWTHFEYNAGRTSASNDSVVDAPNQLQWLAGSHWPDRNFSHQPDSGFASAQGRNFYWFSAYNDKSASRLRCRDAYNGVLLWQKEVGRGAHGSSMIALGDRLYVSLGGEVGMAALDAATGEQRIRFEGSQQDPKAERLLVDGMLVERAGGVRTFDAASGKLLWETPNQFAERDAIVAGDGRVMFLHREKEDGPVRLVCMEIKTGRELWRKDVPALEKKDSTSLICYRDGTILLASSSRAFYMKDERSSVVWAVSAQDGKLLWDYSYAATAHFGRATNVLHMGDMIWVKTSDPEAKKPTSSIIWIGLDAVTGKEKRRFDGVYNRCYADRASARFILTGDVDFLDPVTGEMRGFKAARGQCSTSYMPANGLTYTFFMTCNCYNFVRGLMGFSSGVVPGAPDEQTPPPLLEKGPAFGMPIKSAVVATDWPTLRHDPRRSGATDAVVPTDLAVVWNTTVGGAISSPVAAGGKVLVGSLDGHAVTCLDAATGELQWSYRMGGPVDSPPTVYNGLVLAGSSDGWVYCLRLSDGALLWRMLAAPMDKRLVARGRVESVWPVHGSVLALDGVAYFGAGRHTELNGGIRYYAVEPATGRVIWRRQTSVSRTMPSDSLAGVPISDGERIHIGQRVNFDPATGTYSRRSSKKPVLFPLWGLLSDPTLPGASSGGMAYHVRPWAYKVVRAGGEPRGVSWHYPLKGNLLSVRDPAVYGVLELWRNLPRPRRLIWEAFGSTDGVTKKWKLVYEEYAETPKALVVAGDVMFIAFQSPDAKTGKLRALSCADGRKLGEVALPGAPRWDGMAAIEGRIFIATQNGRVLCLGQK